MLLNGKVALVTGGGRGIGRETCLLLASHGAHIAVCSLFEEECQEVVDVIHKQYKVRTIVVPCDVTNEDQVKKACAFVKEELGPVDILINNAGTMSMLPFVDTTTEEWLRVHDINVNGPYYFCSQIVPDMIAKQEGTIINISSIWGTKGGPNRSAYISSKHAVIGFSKAIGEELKPYGIRVNAVCPGPVDTKMTDELGPDLDKTGWLQPIDMANVIVNIALPHSKAITASSIEAFGTGMPVGLTK